METQGSREDRVMIEQTEHTQEQAGYAPEEARQPERGGDEPPDWTGRDIYDVNGRRIGIISDQGHLGARFGTAWLPVETETGNRVLVPVEQVESSDDRLVLPYPKTYIEGAPAPTTGRRLSRAQERRLCLHYGYDSQLPGVACRQACGLCHVGKRVRLPAAEG